MKNALCVIPARGGSKRVPGKNTRLLMGKPLVAYSIEAALKSRLVTRTVVSTESPEVARVSRDFGAEVVDRPVELSVDTAAIDDALRHAVRHFNATEGFKSDVVVLLQANVPVRKEGEIDEVLKRLMDTPDADSVVTVYEIDQRPEWMKKVDPKTGKIESFMEPSDSFRMQDLPKLYLLDGAIIAIKVDTLMSTEGKRRAHEYLGERVHAFVHDKKYAVEIDEEEDLEMAEYFLRMEQPSA